MYRFIEHICPWIQWRAYNVQPIYLTTSLTYHWGWYMGHDAPLYIFSQWLPAISITSRSTQLERDRFYAKVTGVRAKAYGYFGLPSYERCFYTYSVQTIRSTSIEIEITLCSLSANSHFEQEICIGCDYRNISSKPVTHSRLPDRGCFEIASLIAQRNIYPFYLVWTAILLLREFCFNLVNTLFVYCIISIWMCFCFFKDMCRAWIDLVKGWKLFKLCKQQWGYTGWHRF